MCENKVKITVTFDGKIYFAIIYDWFYAVGDTKKEAIANVKKRMEAELNYR